MPQFFFAARMSRLVTAETGGVTQEANERSSASDADTKLHSRVPFHLLSRVSSDRVGGWSACSVVVFASSCVAFVASFCLALVWVAQLLQFMVLLRFDLVCLFAHNSPETTQLFLQRCLMFLRILVVLVSTAVFMFFGEKVPT